MRHLIASTWSPLKASGDGMPDKLIYVIRSTYNGMACKVIHARQLTTFMVKTGLRQGCLLSPFSSAGYGQDNEKNHR